jgi:hypothetical protein
MGKSRRGSPQHLFALVSLWGMAIVAAPVVLGWPAVEKLTQRL